RSNARIQRVPARAYRVAPPEAQHGVGLAERQVLGAVLPAGRDGPLLAADADEHLAAEHGAALLQVARGDVDTHLGGEERGKAVPEVLATTEAHARTGADARVHAGHRGVTRRGDVAAGQGR